MLNKKQQKQFGARPLAEKPAEYPYFVNSQDVRDGLDPNHIHPETHTATAILNYIKLRYQQHLLGADAVPVGSGNYPDEVHPSLGLPVLERYLGDALEDFLAELFDIYKANRSGPGIHEDSEFMFRPLTAQTKSLLWVRAEYVRVRMYLEEKSMKHHVVITGQPGIGKSWLLFYLAFCRIRQGKPVLFRVPEAADMFYFDGTYSYLISRKAFIDNDRWSDFRLNMSLTKDLWILIDAWEHEKYVPGWSYKILGARVIYASSPEEDRWEKPQQAGFQTHTVVMDPYSKAEACLLAILELETLQDGHPDAEKAKGLPISHQRKLQLFKTSQQYFEYSPSPRSFIDNAWYASEDNLWPDASESESNTSESETEIDTAGLEDDVGEMETDAADDAAESETDTSESETEIDAAGSEDAAAQLKTDPAQSKTDPAAERLELLYDKTSRKINDTDASILKSLFKPRGSRNSNQSHRIICMWRATKHKDYYVKGTVDVDYEVLPLNQRVASYILRKLMSISEDAREEFYFTMRLNSTMKTMAGKMFERRLAELWEERGVMELDLHSPTKTKRRSILFEPNNTPHAVKGSRRKIEVTRCVKQSSLPEDLIPSFLYYPQESNHAGIDMIIRTPQGEYFGIQVTVSGEHKISPRLRAVLSNAGVPLPQYTHVVVLDMSMSNRKTRKEPISILLPKEQWPNGFDCGQAIEAAWIEPWRA